MKISEKCKVIAAGTIVAALMAGTALPALAISPAGCTSLAQIEEMNDDEEAQVQALKAAIAKVNVKYDEVQRSWQFDSPIYDKAEKNKTCCLSLRGSTSSTDARTCISTRTFPTTALPAST